MTIDMIKAYLYNYCKNFNSLNNIYLNVKCSKQDIQEIYTLYGIEMEFFEDEYLLEALDNPDAIKNTFDNFRCLSISALSYHIYIHYKFVNKKRANYNHNDMREMFFINEEFDI